MLNLYARCCGAGNLVSAWVDLTYICKQNESSLELKLASDWPHNKSCMEALPTIS